MTQHPQLAKELIAEAEKLDGFRAGIAAIDEVLGALPTRLQPKEAGRPTIQKILLRGCQTPAHFLSWPCIIPKMTRGWTGLTAATPPEIAE